MDLQGELFVDLRTIAADIKKKSGNGYRDEHRAYFTGLKERGKLLMAGPFKDGSGGMAIFIADSLQEATTLSNNDPTVIHGLQIPHIRPWRTTISL